MKKSVLELQKKKLTYYMLFSIQSIYIYTYIQIQISQRYNVDRGRGRYEKEQGGIIIILCIIVSYVNKPLDSFI